ncbi:MAG: prepilin-type N-terminal cleavage/methylation domain-containing protein [Candidatus Riflebacteria bacterium]|nr:prepilin-type N-terminal cleavage/methylation domain-containing protein [Candidatus Riflebacteria bacterium]
MMPGSFSFRPAGYNLVEVLVTLTIVSIITVTLVNFVNDLDTRHKVAIARADINRIAVAAHLSEAEMSKITTVPGSSVPLLNLSTNSKLAWLLNTKLLDLPSEDPWGNRFVRKVSTNSVVSYVAVTGSVAITVGSTPPTPYIIDEGLGRVVSAGPDGIVDTRIGQDPADSESDLIVEYRHKPWLFYNVGGKMYVNSADGAAAVTNTAGIEMGSGLNAQVSPDGLRYAAVRNGNTLVIGSLAWALETEGATPKPRTNEVILAPRDHCLQFRQNAWTSSGAVAAVDEATFPLWVPDSSGVVFIAGGDLYRYDPSRGKQEGSDRGEVILLATATGLGDVQSGASRVLTSTRHHALYFNDDKKFYLAVASDGKVVFRTGEGNILMVLSDGTGRRYLKTKVSTSDDYRPIVWLDSANLVYWNHTTKRLYRIAQDGTIDIPLHDAGKPSVEAMLNPSLSPEGKYLAFLGSTSRCYVVKTDGSGLVVKSPSQEYATGANMSGVPPIVWRLSKDCADHRLFYVPTSDPDKPITVGRFDKHDVFYYQVESITDPDSCEFQNGALSSGESTQKKLLEGLNPLSFDLSRDEKLLAIVSNRDPNMRPAGARGGLFVLPITGSSLATTRFELPPASTWGSYAYVSWLLN